MGTNQKVSQELMLAEWEEIQAAQQNPARFRPLYDRYYERIFRFVLKRVADENTTADLCSQVFLKAMQKLGSYQFKGVPFSAWLYRIASNEVTQYYRNTQRQRVVSLQETDLSGMHNEIDDVPDDLPRAVLLKVLDELPLKDIQLIEMRFFERRPFKEIADILNVTESNAKVKTYRLLAKLKKIIEAKI